MGITNIGKVGKNNMAISHAFIREIVSKAVNDYELTPANKAEIINDASDNMIKHFKERITHRTNSILVTLVQKLYNRDNKALKTDLTKIIMLDAVDEATKQERFRLLQCLFSTMQMYLGDDISPLLNSISSDIAFEERFESGESDLPFN